MLAAGDDSNIGLLGELVRDAHEAVPFFPIGKENNRYRNLQNAMVYAAAVDATNGYKPHKTTIDHFTNMYEHSARDMKAQSSLMAAALTQNNIALRKSMEQIAQLRGGWQNVPQNYIQRYEKNAQMIADLRSDKFNHENFVKKYKLNANNSYQRYLDGKPLQQNDDNQQQNGYVDITPRELPTERD